MSIVIQAANSNDLPGILMLLEKSGLPQDGLSDHGATTLVAREDQAIQASAALELYGTVALLRSVAVVEWTTACPVTAQAMVSDLNLAE